MCFLILYYFPQLQAERTYSPPSNLSFVPRHTDLRVAGSVKLHRNMVLRLSPNHKIMQSR